MAINVQAEQRALEAMTTAELRTRYAEVCGTAANSGQRDHLIRRILWRLQALAEGDLSERACRRARELADEGELRLTAPVPRHAPVRRQKRRPTRIERSSDRRLPPPGVVLTRVYKGRLLEVTVLEEGFEYEGRRFRTLSALARKITGTHTNGFHFFRLANKGVKP